MLIDSSQLYTVIKQTDGSSLKGSFVHFLKDSHNKFIDLLMFRLSKVELCVVD